ncbi:MAG: glycosyltransferase [Proteobacteria bacterium]|nr:glycosyltransferase [Pseudomonadota bacterium]
MRVALVHDWLTGLRGGERVLHELAGMFPDADLYTLVHVPGSTSDAIERLRVHASPLSHWPGAARHYRKLLPLFPWAIRRFRLEGYDLVLSSSHAVAKSVRRPDGAVHVCYCHTPMRYVWDRADAYLGRGLLRALASPAVFALRRFDVSTSGPDCVTRFVANSNEVAARIRRHYRRDAEVVFPPVDVERFRPTGAAPDDFYLLIGGFVAYKNEGIALEAFRRLGRRLVVAGDGPGRARLEARAPANVEFTGRISDAELAGLAGRCRALVHPQEEDFGIAAVEAQAAGRPVIALGRGGALDTVVPMIDADSNGLPEAPAPTGVHFDQPTPEALAEAVERFEKLEARFDGARIRAWAERFGAPRFRRELTEQIDTALAHRPC